VSSRDVYEPVRREYSGIASRYDRRWRFYLEASIGETLRRIEVAPADLVLDVGCGTGLLLASLSRAAPRARLTGVDLSAEMLEVARRRLPPGVDLSRAMAECLPFEDAAFDVVVSTNVLHFVRRPAAALQEMRRVLRTSGRVVITDWCDDYLPCRVCDLLLRVFDRAHFRTYGSDRLRELLAEAGFTTFDVERYRIDWLWGLMTATACKDAAIGTAGSLPRGEP